jgi:pimeloyl-ACP methyl ester carboxylesterase
VQRSEQRTRARSEVEDFQRGFKELIVDETMASTRAGHVVGGIRELPVQFGPDGQLVGVLATPNDPPSVQNARPAGTAPPTVILLNAGVIHRVGPHRLHVLLARGLAALGISSFRMDLSGIGDSRAVPGATSFRQSSVADARVAMDHLAAETGATRFILFGLCSGADNALATARVDDRVVGLVIVDPPVYSSPRSRLRELRDQVRRLGGVRAVAGWGAGVVGRRVRAGVARLRRAEPAPAGRGQADGSPDSDPDPGEGPGGEDQGGRGFPPRDDYRRQLEALLDRGVGIFSIYSGALGDRYNHEDQLFELFPSLRGRVDRAYFPTANHVFTERAAQAELRARVIEWVARRR